MILDRLARDLPEVPRWVETCSVLLSGRYEVLVLEEGEDPSFVVCDTEDGLISVLGRPGRNAIQEAIAREREGDDDHRPTCQRFSCLRRCRSG